MTKTNPAPDARLPRLPRLIPVPEVAEALDLAESTGWEHIRQGRIHAVRLGRRATRIPEHEYQRIVAEGLRGAA